MADSSKPRKCECGGKAIRNIQAEHSQGNVDGLMKDNFRWSWALGVDPRQIPEAMKLHPGAVFNEKGQMGIKHRTDKLRRMKEANFDEY